MERLPEYADPGHKGPNRLAGEKGPDTGFGTSQRFTDDRKAAYCEALADLGRRSHAAVAIGVSMATISHHSTPGHQYFDPDFAAGCELARVRYGDKLLKEVERRALTGTLKDIYQSGKLVGQVREYSDRLLLSLTRMHVPGMREKIEVERVGGEGTLAAGLKSLDVMTDEDRVIFRKLLENRVNDEVKEITGPLIDAEVVEETEDSTEE